MHAQIILASASPRRRELLHQIGVQYVLHAVAINETPGVNEFPERYVKRMAAEKSAVARQTAAIDLPVLAADTSVVLDGKIMGKPRHRENASNMLLQLSGRTHTVYSAVSLRGSKHWQIMSTTQVTFRHISAQEIDHYWQSGEPADKAGAYAIQGLGGVFVAAIKGSYSGVVGLPLFETATLLSKQGIQIFHE